MQIYLSLRAPKKLNYVCLNDSAILNSNGMYNVM